MAITGRSKTAKQEQEKQNEARWQILSVRSTNHIVEPGGTEEDLKKVNLQNSLFIVK